MAPSTPEVHMKTFLLPFIAVCLFATGSFGAGPTNPPEPPAPTEDGTMPKLTSIAGHSMLDCHAYNDLEELSDEIGGRVTGSPQAAKAIEWGLAKMRAIGLSNVHADKWQMSHGWSRASASAEMVAPAQRRLIVDSMGWVGSTPKGGVEAEVVAVNIYQLDQEMKDNAGK